MAAYICVCAHACACERFCMHTFICTLWHTCLAYILLINMCTHMFTIDICLLLYINTYMFILYIPVRCYNPTQPHMELQCSLIIYLLLVFLWCAEIWKIPTPFWNWRWIPQQSIVMSKIAFGEIRICFTNNVQLHDAFYRDVRVQACTFHTTTGLGAFLTHPILTKNRCLIRLPIFVCYTECRWHD